MKWTPCLVVCLATGACSSSSTSSAADAGISPPEAEAEASDTWDSWARGFFTTYCVECHSASDPKGRDYTLKANVVREKLEIRCGVASTQDPSWGCASFPPAQQFPIRDSSGTNPKPGDVERARAVAWITAGCP